MRSECQRSGSCGVGATAGRGRPIERGASFSSPGMSGALPRDLGDVNVVQNAKLSGLKVGWERLAAIRDGPEPLVRSIHAPASVNCAAIAPRYSPQVVAADRVEEVIARLR